MNRFTRIATCPLLALAVVLLAASAASAAVTCYSAPAAVGGTTGRVDVFVLGSDYQVYQCFYDRDKWQWRSLGGNARHGVGASRSTTGQLHVFTVAKDGHLVQKVFDKDKWSKDWEDLGTPEGVRCVSAPAAVQGVTG